MIGGGTGPADGTNATTCTPGPWNLAMMLKADERKEKLSKCFDRLEEKFGKDIIQTGFIKKDV